MKAWLPLFALLAACDQKPPSPAANVAVTELAPAKPAAPAAKAFSYDEEGKFYEFHFGWSAEVAAVPYLTAKFQAELNKIKARLKANADEAANHTYSVSKDILTGGQSNRLLSLVMEVYEFSGGMHGNGGTGALLWDRQAAREIQVANLFAEPANMSRLLTQRWCDALNKAREEKRGEPVGGGGMFDECPKLSEIAILPTDKDRNGRFERLMLVASPYVAGPYVEGSYEIDLAVTPDLIAALKADYRGSFEAAQPQ